MWGTNACSLALKVKPSLIEEIKLHQKHEAKLQRIRQNPRKEKSPRFVTHVDGILRFQN